MSLQDQLRGHKRREVERAGKLEPYNLVPLTPKPIHREIQTDNCGVDCVWQLFELRTVEHTRSKSRRGCCLVTGQI